MSQKLADKSHDPVIWRCAVPSPLRRPFDYRPPADWTGVARPGARVSVSFGKRAVTAIVLSVASESPVEESKLRPATALLDEQPLYTTAQLSLLSWAAGYYQHPIGEVMPLGLSPGERRGKPERATGQAGLRLTSRGQGLPRGRATPRPQAGRTGHTIGSRRRHACRSHERGLQPIGHQSAHGSFTGRNM